MNALQNKVGGGFWLAWVLASIVGYVLGVLLGAHVATGLFGREAFDTPMTMTLGIVMGATGGFVQWLVLRERVARAGWWVLATALGFAAAFGTPGAMGTADVAVVGIMLVIVFGVAVGILQWLVLRRVVMAGASLWVLANILGSLVGSMGFPLNFAVGATGNLSVMIVGAMFGVGLGAIPGAALVWLLRQPQSSNTEDMATAHESS